MRRSGASRVNGPPAILGEPDAQERIGARENACVQSLHIQRVVAEQDVEQAVGHRQGSLLAVGSLPSTEVPSFDQ